MRLLVILVRQPTCTLLYCSHEVQPSPNSIANPSLLTSPARQTSLGRSSAIPGRGVPKAPLGLRPVELGGAGGGGGNAFGQQGQGKAVARPYSVVLKQSFWDSLAGGGGGGGAKKPAAGRAGAKGKSFESPLPKGFPPGW